MNIESVARIFQHNLSTLARESAAARRPSRSRPAEAASRPSRMA